MGRYVPCSLVWFWVNHHSYLGQFNTNYVIYKKKLKFSINYFCFRLINYLTNMCWSCQGTMGSSWNFLYNLRLILNGFFFNYSISQNWWIFAEKKTFNTEKYCYPCGSGFKVIDWNDPKKSIGWFLFIYNWCHRIGKFWL
jgi:hypothetical protein